MEFGIKQILREKLMDEARRSSGYFNKEENLYALLEYLHNKYGFENTYLSFRESLHTGTINPRNQYETPTGLYAYNLIKYLKEPIHSVLAFRKLFPFASDRPYGQFIVLKPNANVLNSKSDIGKIDASVRKIEALYPDIQPIQGLCVNWLDRKYKSYYGEDKNNAHRFWLFLYDVASYLGGKKQHKFLLLCKKIGVDGFEDDTCEGWIHPNEKCQTVFFNANAFEEKREILLRPKTPAKTNQKTGTKPKDIETKNDLVNLLNKHNENIPLTVILGRLKTDDDGNIILLKDESIKKLFYEFYKTQIVNSLSQIGNYPKQMMFFIMDLLKDTSIQDKLLSDDNINTILRNSPEGDQMVNLILKYRGDKINDNNAYYLLQFAKDKDSVVNTIFNLKKDDLSDSLMFNLLHYSKDKEKAINLIGVDKIRGLSDYSLANLITHSTNKSEILNLIFKYFSDKINDNLVGTIMNNTDNLDSTASLIIKHKGGDLNDNAIGSILRRSTDKSQIINLILKYKGDNLNDKTIDTIMAYVEDKEAFINILGPEKINKLPPTSVYNILYHAPTEKMASLLGATNIKKLTGNEVSSLISNIDRDYKEEIINIILKYKGGVLSDNNINTIIQYTKNPLNILNKIGLNRIDSLSDGELTKLLSNAEDKEQIVNLILKYKHELSDNIVRYILHYSPDKDKAINSILKLRGDNLSDNNIINLLKYVKDKEKMFEVLGADRISKISANDFGELLGGDEDRISDSLKDEAQKIIDLIIKYTGDKLDKDYIFVLLNNSANIARTASMLGKDNFNKLEDKSIASLLSSLSGENRDNFVKLLIELKGDDLSDAIFNYIVRYSNDAIKDINQLIKLKGGKLNNKNIDSIVSHVRNLNELLDIIGWDNFNKLSDENINTLLAYATIIDRKSIINLTLKHKKDDLSGNLITRLLNYSDKTDKLLVSNTIIKLKGGDLDDVGLLNLLRYNEIENIDEIINQILKYKGGNLSDKNIYDILYYTRNMENMFKVLGPENIDKLTGQHLGDLLGKSSDEGNMFKLIGPENVKKIPSEILNNMISNLEDKGKFINLILKYRGNNLSNDNMDYMMHYSEDKDLMAKTLIELKGEELNDNTIASMIQGVDDKYKLASLVVKHKGNKFSQSIVYLLLSIASNKPQMAEILGPENINKLRASEIKSLINNTGDSKVMVDILGPENINKLTHGDITNIINNGFSDIKNYWTPPKDNEVTENIKQKSYVKQ